MSKMINALVRASRTSDVDGVVSRWARVVSVAVAVALATVATPVAAFADGEPAAVVEDDLEKAAASKVKAADKEARKDGWSKKLTLGANGSLTSADSVVGAVDGTT